MLDLVGLADVKRQARQGAVRRAAAPGRASPRPCSATPTCCARRADRRPRPGTARALPATWCPPPASGRTVVLSRPTRPRTWRRCAARVVVLDRPSCSTAPSTTSWTAAAGRVWRRRARDPARRRAWRPAPGGYRHVGDPPAGCGRSSSRRSRTPTCCCSAPDPRRWPRDHHPGSPRSRGRDTAAPYDADRLPGRSTPAPSAHSRRIRPDGRRDDPVLAQLREGCVQHASRRSPSSTTGSSPSSQPTSSPRGRGVRTPTSSWRPCRPRTSDVRQPCWQPRWLPRRWSLSSWSRAHVLQLTAHRYQVVPGVWHMSQAPVCVLGAGLPGLRSLDGSPCEAHPSWSWWR